MDTLLAGLLIMAGIILTGTIITETTGISRLKNGGQKVKRRLVKHEILSGGKTNRLKSRFGGIFYFI
jgi:hypothetical protein